MTCGVAQALRLGMTARGLRLHRQHLGFDGRLCQRGRAAARDLHPARQHLVTASWRRRSNTARRTFQVEANFDQILALVRQLAERLGHLPAELDQSVPHRRAEDHHGRDDGPARLERAGLGRAAGRQSGQHLGVRQRRCARLQELGLHRPAAAAGGGAGRRVGAVLRPDALRPTARSCTPVEHPETLATAIKIGDPVSWPKALHEIWTSATAWWRR